MLKGVIFDLDGTLLDSMGIWEQIDIQFLSSRGFDVPEDYAQTIAPMGFLQAAEYTIRRFPCRIRLRSLCRNGTQWLNVRTGKQCA